MKALLFDEYERLSEKGGWVPVYRELPGDLLTPVSAFQALAARAPRAFLLESVIGGERLARYSFAHACTFHAVAFGDRVNATWLRHVEGGQEGWGTDDLVDFLTGALLGPAGPG